MNKALQRVSAIVTVLMCVLYVPAAQAANCSASVCTAYCFNSPQSVCQQLQPGCNYIGYDCTWWNANCWGTFDYEFVCASAM